jgi:hypothetical protein
VQTAVMTRELHHLIQNDRYPLSPRIVALKKILGQLRPEPEREEPLTPRRHYEPPSRGGSTGTIAVQKTIRTPPPVHSSDP